MPATLRVPVAGWPKKRELGPLSSGQGMLMQFVDPDRIEQSDRVQAASFAPYNAVVISTILYGCETWVPYRRHIRLLDYFHIRRLLLILGLRWWHKVTHSEIRPRAGISTIESMLLHRQLRRFGHIIRMPDSRLTHRVLYGQLRLGRRSVGGQMKRFKDHI